MKSKFFSKFKSSRLADNRWIFTSMLVGAIFSLIASFMLSYDAIELYRNPDANLTCEFSLVLNCATVAKHPSAELLGFPNSFFGLMAEPVVITVAIAGLAGVVFPRRFMFAAQIGYSLGFIFAWYLFFVSYFVIGALCPWCLLVTLTTTLVWFAITRYNIREKNLYLPAKASKALQQFTKKSYDKLLMWSMIVLAVAAILFKYGDSLFI